MGITTEMKKELKSQCIRQWENQSEESKLVTLAKKTIDSEAYRKTHQELKGALFCSISHCLDTKRGNYFEFALSTLCGNFKHLHLFHTNVLPNKDSENEKRLKNKCKIHVPIEITYFVNSLETDIREKNISYREESDVLDVLHRLYNRTQEIKKIYNSKDYNPSDYTDYSLDLDLGIYDSDLDEYFLYEVKSKGLAGGDAIPEHIHKLFMNYCSIVFNNDVPFDKIHFSWVLISNFTNNKLYKGHGGYIDLETFCARHQIDIDAGFKKIIIEEISCIKDDEIYALVKRILRVYKEFSECDDRSSENYKTPAQFKATYKKFYNSRFEK